MAEIPVQNLEGFENIKISMETPLDDYKKYIKAMEDVHDPDDDDLTIARFYNISVAARDTIWEILFDVKDASKELLDKASVLLKEYKKDACIYAPFPYNEFIVEVRTMLIHNDRMDFWHEEIVNKEMGPCSGRDCELLSDSDTEEAVKFYEHIGSIAPWEKPRELPPLPEITKTPRPRTDSKDLLDLADVEISRQRPLRDFKDAMETYLNQDLDDDQTQRIFKYITKIARDVVWDLLFPPSDVKQYPGDLKKAADLLEEYKQEAAFFWPYEYNEWIVTLRDKVLEKDMVDFWRDSMVKRKLGPCCSKDSDFFEVADDKEAFQFYERAGCVAPYKEEEDEEEEGEE